MKTFKTPKGSELPILNLKGKDYLQVAHRLVWFREECPDWCIETTLFRVDDAYCIVKAEVRHPSGFVYATAHKREDAKHFPDFMEKAETGAIGRALALVGFGTQFTADELEEGNRLADAPLPPKIVPRPTRTEWLASTQAIDIRPPHEGHLITPAMANKAYLIDQDGGIYPQQPPEDGSDGNTDPNARGYVIPFGKFKQRSLEEVGADELRGYVNYLESKALKDGKAITGVAADFVERAAEYIGSFENRGFHEDK